MEARQAKDTPSPSYSDVELSVTTRVTVVPGSSKGEVLGRCTCRVGKLDPNMLQQAVHQVQHAVLCEQPRSPVLPQDLPRYHQPSCCEGNTGEAEVAHSKAQPVRQVRPCTPCHLALVSWAASRSRGSHYGA